MCAVKTDVKAAGWSRRYRAALRMHMKAGPGASLQPALQLGQRAVELGLETLDVAAIHEQVLASRKLSGGTARDVRQLFKRATAFFVETLVPIEKTHRAARKAKVSVDRLTLTLRRRTAESSVSSRRLADGIARRRAAEAALKKSLKHLTRLLQESSRLQDRMRVQTREFLSRHEGERRKSSRQLHDEIAQALLAINVRLLTMKMAAKASSQDLEKEVAGTQRLVKQSVAMIRRVAHEFGVRNEV